jgi:ERCC4-type nuclease
MSDFTKFVLKPNPKKMRENEAKIFIDTREGDSIQYFTHVLSRRFKRSNIFHEKMAVGDFEIQSTDGMYQVIIERKSAKDFVTSWYDGRLESQIPELSEYDDSILLVHDKIYEEEIWKDEDGKFRKNFAYPESIDKILTSMAFRKLSHGGRPALVQCKNKKSVPVILDYVARLIEDDRLIRQRNPIKKNSKKYSNIKDPIVHRNVILNRLACVPKLGKSKAETVLTYFDWNEEKLNKASIDELLNMKIKGIGKTLATRIWETIHSGVYSG